MNHAPTDKQKTQVNSVTGVYIKISYTAFFERYHDEQLEHLAHPSLTAGSDDLAVEFLKRHGGALYLPKFVADRMLGLITDLRIVEDAPIILQPVYSIIHIRKRNDPHVSGALKELKKFSASRI